jgi:ankyrin repeat protein
MDFISLLIEKGAGSDFQDDQRMTALDYAKANGNDKIIELLESSDRNRN